jgi:hypothetical protein
MYERGFAGVTALAVDGGGDLLVADDPGVGMGVLDAEGHGRLWRVPVRSVARPSVRVDAAPAGVSPSTQARFAYSSSTGSTFECRLDGAPWSVCPGTGSGQSDYTDLSDGVHEFEVRAVNADQAGVSARRVFVVDTRAPRVWIAAPESGRTILGRPVTVELLADEARVDFMCSLDGSEFAFCGSTQILEGLSAGDHELRVRGLDAAGNVSDDQAPGTHWAFHTAAPAPVAAPATGAPAAPAAVSVPPAATPAPEVQAAAPVGHATRRPTRRTRPGRPIGVKVTATRVAPARGGRALRLRVSFRAPARAQAVHVTLEADGRRIAARRARVRGGANTVVLRLTAAEARRAHSGILRATVTVADRAGRVGAASSVPVRIA